MAVTADLPGFTILNAGSGQPTTLGELLQLATEVSGVTLRNRYRTPGPETLVRMQACTKYAEALLKFQPQFDLRRGLEDTFKWFL